MLLNPDQQQQQQQLQQMALQASNELDPAYAQFRDQTRFWIQRVAVPLLMVIGLFGNSITVIIMTRRRMRSTTNMYLAALAFVDMLYLVLTFLLGLSHYPNMAGHKYYAYWKLRPFLMMLTDACSNTSVWLTVTFTIERYIAVKYPMKGKVWCTEVRAKMLIVCVFVFGILFASPVPFEWEVIEKRIPTANPVVANETSIASRNEPRQQQNASKPSIDHAIDDPGGPDDDNGDSDKNIVGDFPASLHKNDTFSRAKSVGESMMVGDGGESFILALDYSDFGKNETYKTIYYWSTAVIFYFIPLFSLMLFNGFLIKSVHQSKRERTKMTRPSTTSSTQSSTLITKADISVTVNGNESEQPSTMKPQSWSERKFKLLSSSISRHKGNRISKDSPTIEENSQSSPLLEHGNSGAKKNENLVTVGPIGQHSPTITVAPPPPLAVADVMEANNQATIIVVPHIDDTIETGKALGELNVQINCDNESVCTTKPRTEPKNGGGGPPIEDKQQQQSQQTNNSSGIMDQKETVKTIGVPQGLYSPLRRSQMTYSSSRSHHSMAPASTQERRITIMLIAVVILFLVCQIPSAAMLLYTSVHELAPNTNEHALVLAFGNIFNFLMAVNAAGNFILYSFLSKKYRRTFMILFCSCFGSEPMYVGPKRLFSVRFQPCGGGGQSLRNSSSIYQNNKTSDKVHRDTLV